MTESRHQTLPLLAAVLAGGLFIGSGAVGLRAAEENVEQPISTQAGEFRIVDKGVRKKDGSHRCRILLGNKTLKKFNCKDSYLPKVIGYFANGVGNLEEVIVLQEFPTGDSCSGGPLHILGICKNGRYEIAPPIGYCGRGAHAPVLEQQGGKIVITFPGGPPYVDVGEGQIKTEIWKYENGKVRRVK